MNNKEIIKFGNYNEKTIEWLILERNNNKLFLVSKNIISFKPFNDKLEATTWEKSSIRKWLNNDFLNDSFSLEEFNKIQTTRVKTTDDWYSNSNGGNATNDKIFLLSNEEVLKYFVSKEERICKSQDSDNNYPWWIRNMGSRQSSASYITVDGEFSSQNAKRDNYGIRCAMWIDLDAIKDEFVMPEKKYVEFGSYYQSDNASKEKILWRVLDETSDKLFLVSEKGLDSKAYYTECCVEWDESSLKTWLNDTFLKNAFNEEEVLNICGEVSILSVKEAINLFEDRVDRRCIPTDYVVNNGGYKSSDGFSFYWLRTNGDEDCKMMVNSDGSINKAGIVGKYKNIIRPVIWIRKR